MQTLRVPTDITEQEEVQVEVTRVLVESYFDIARKNLQDAVPKAVMHFLVRFPLALSGAFHPRVLGFRIVGEHLQDAMPKAVMHFLVRHLLKTFLQGVRPRDGACLAVRADAILIFRCECCTMLCSSCTSMVLSLSPSFR